MSNKFFTAPNLPPMMPVSEQASATPEQLVEGNLRLAAKIAADLGYTEHIREDLFQEGVKGLMKAASKFDSNKGASFGTYASWWIKQFMYRYLFENRSDIRVPLHHAYKSKEGKLHRAAHEAHHHVFSMQACENEEGELKLDLTEDVEKAYDKEYLYEAINQVLDQLDEREKYIINSRFGLNQYIRKTLDELGAELNLTRERIRQIQNIALKKMHLLFSKLEKVGY